MRTVQMTLDEELVLAVDQAAERLSTSRSAFTRKALRDALARHQVLEQEERHRRGYQQQPVSSEEFSAWEGEQDWGDL